MNLNQFYWFVGIIIVSDLALLYTAYLWWKKQEEKSFGLHIVLCNNCDEPHIVSQDVDFIEECSYCHVCESCGKWLVCKTCGKRELVRQEVSSIEFCNGVGCFEKYKLNQKKLERISKKKSE